MVKLNQEETMQKFLFIFYGWKLPEPPEEEQKKMKVWVKVWGDWFGSLGKGLINMGERFEESVVVEKDKTVTDKGNAKAGYSFVEAESMEKAIQLAKACPIYEDGGKIEIVKIEKMNAEKS